MNISSGNRMIFQRDHSQVPILRKRAAGRDRRGGSQLFCLRWIVCVGNEPFQQIVEKLKKITFST
jgi:hypothetical protein